jgi:hypothetical protein
MPDLVTLWPVGLVGIAIVVALWILQKVAESLIESVTQRVFGQLLPRRGLLGRANQKRYRKAVSSLDMHHQLGFLHGVKVDIAEIYVPTQCEALGQRTDLFDSARFALRLVVLGSAGAGKSMFMRYWMYKWTQASGSFSRVPVLVDLNLYGLGTADSLLNLIHAKLAMRGVRAPIDSLEEALDGGRLTLLLDGLDEVVADLRNRLLMEIKSLCELHPKTQVLVTCRDAVYADELGPVFPKPVTIAGFDDAAMRSFLWQWFKHEPTNLDVSSVKSDKRHLQLQVENVMVELQASPAMHRMARSPLLLAMIASLHTADPGVGPLFSGVRTDFFRQAIDHMLKRDKDIGRFGGIARHRGDHKKLVLRRIALEAQGGIDSGPYRRTLTEEQVQAHIDSVLQLRRVDAMEGPSMLEEIVTRSELLMRVDADSHLFEFPHLSLQEYLASVEIGNDDLRLWNFYRAYPARWRETIKMWCGDGEHNCTKLVQAIFGGNDADRLLALECLAEARTIDPQLAEKIVRHFTSNEIGSNHAQRALVIAAFGAVAADPRSWGQDAFRYLKDSAQSSMSSAARDAAIQALAATRLPAAVDLLSECASDRVTAPVARAALRSIGELAIPQLSSRAAAGFLSAVDDLAAIGTPSAAVALAELVYRDREIGIQAAWHIAHLVSNPGVEEELRANAPEGFYQPREWIDWVWSPFDSANSRLGRLMGRVAFLVSITPRDLAVDAKPADPRLAIPLTFIDRFGSLKSVPDSINRSSDLYTAYTVLAYKIGTLQTISGRRGTKKIEPQVLAKKDDLYNILKAATKFDEDYPEVRDLCAEILRTVETDRVKRRLIWMLPWKARVQGLATIYCNDTEDLAVDKNAWTTVHDVVRKPRTLEKIDRFINGVGIFALIMAGIFAFARSTLSVTGLWSGYAWLSYQMLAAILVAGAAYARGIRKDSRTLELITSLAVLVAIVSGCLIVAGSISEVVPWFIDLSIAIIYVATSITVKVKISRKRRAYANPLRSLLALCRSDAV